MRAWKTEPAVRRAAGRFALGLALAIGAGCSADVTGPFPEAAALLVGTLVVEVPTAAPEVGGASLEAPAGVSFSGRLDPGRDARGRLRGVEVERLGLPSGELVPAAREGAGIRLYEGSWDVPWSQGAGGAGAPGSSSRPGPPGPMEVTPPTVAGIAPSEVPFRFGPCAAQRILDEGAAVTVACDRTLTRPVHVEWRLVVRRPSDNAAVLRLEGGTEPPLQIRVPESWLPAQDRGQVGGADAGSGSAPTPWIVELEITDRYGWAQGGGSYRTNLVVRWRYRWPG